MIVSDEENLRTCWVYIRKLQELAETDASFDSVIPAGVYNKMYGSAYDMVAKLQSGAMQPDEVDWIGEATKIVENCASGDMNDVMKQLGNIHKSAMHLVRANNQDPTGAHLQQLQQLEQFIPH